MQYGLTYEEPTRWAVLTGGYDLHAKHVIHMVGFIVTCGLTNILQKDQENCYQNVLKCCVENDIRSVAFCCISTGEFHFPNEEATKIAVEIVTGFLEDRKRSRRELSLMCSRRRTGRYMRGN